jgi:hypothetical protein
MTLLAKQVGGQLAVIRDHGTCFQLSIPVQ